MPAPGPRNTVSCQYNCTGYTLPFIIIVNGFRVPLRKPQRFRVRDRETERARVRETEAEAEPERKRSGSANQHLYIKIR